MVDYELLGGLLGSAWSDNHPEATEDERSLARGLFMRTTFPGEGGVGSSLFYRAVYNTMRGRCYHCGEKTDLRWSVGVYTCPMCAVNKPGVQIRGKE
jgi:hypothetical protein